MSLAASPSHLGSSLASVKGSTGRPHPAATSENAALLLALTSTAASLAPLAGARLTVQQSSVPDSSVQEASAHKASSAARGDREEDEAECPMLLAA